MHTKGSILCKHYNHCICNSQTKHLSPADNGNDNGNCVGNCFHNIEGNANGNANTDIEGKNPC